MNREEFNEIVGKIKRSLGILQLNSAQLHSIEQWVLEYGLDWEIIGWACKKAVQSGTYRPSEYANRLLQQYIAEGITNIDECKKDDEARHKKIAEHKKAKSTNDSDLETRVINLEREIIELRAKLETLSR